MGPPLYSYRQAPTKGVKESVGDVGATTAFRLWLATVNVRSHGICGVDVDAKGIVAIVVDLLRHRCQARGDCE